MAKVKICGITNLEDALVTARLRADALGFIFYKKSPRYINPSKAKDIIKKLPSSIKKVGVFVNSRTSIIRRIDSDLKLDMLQLHGNESAKFCSKLKGFKLIKAFRISNRIDLARLSKYKVWAYLFDTFVKNKYGGTGKSFNYSSLNCIRATKKTIFLSGGLSPKNVARALKDFPAQWVDASSSLEKYPAKKDPNKIKRFISGAKA